ncbi:hypothetical protein L6164_028244 [Bauhinia variegata]|uniref:Uncharacterized protein n=1 Tax=Bauhinia variegata TaxID=167791 RepID=A0ACB9LWK4_BAUVA|nr:hypothetical protein L6164_028244 [Bauhinia variegata]
MEDSLPSGTLGVIVEAELEDVLQVLRVAGDGDEPLFPSEEWDGTDTSLVGAGTGAEIICYPVMHAIGVADEIWKAAQQWPNTRSVEGPRDECEP